MTVREIHEQTIKVYGPNEMIDKTIQEFGELSEKLRDYKYGVGDLSKIVDELSDCYNMLDKMCVLFDFKTININAIKHAKMLRTKGRLQNDKK